MTLCTISIKRSFIEAIPTDDVHIERRRAHSWPVSRSGAALRYTPSMMDPLLWNFEPGLDDEKKLLLGAGIDVKKTKRQRPSKAKRMRMRRYDSKKQQLIEAEELPQFQMHVLIQPR